MTNASVNEFTEAKSKMPANRQKITSVGPYILELYEGILLDMGTETVVIEVNKKHTDGSYSSEGRLRFDSKEEAVSVYNDIKDSVDEVEMHL